MQPTQESEKMQNVCGLRLQDLDFNLVEATLASIETKSLTPIIKEELKLKIQTQRLAAGKAELPKPVFKEPEKFELTEEEQQKRDYRRERNRIAAAKCRNKRKSHSENIKTSVAEEELKNYTLKRRIEELEKEKEKMIKKLKLQQVLNAQPVKSPLYLHSASPSPSPSSMEPSSGYVPSPSPPPPSLPPPYATTTFIDMPSTSTAMFNQDYQTPIPRRYSEDLPRNLGSPAYQPRRFSADCRYYFSGYNTDQQTAIATTQAPNNEITDDNFNQNVTETKTNIYNCSENQTNALLGPEIDLLSDEEFFRFENETIPFEQYQRVMTPNQNFSCDYSGNMATTDGVKCITESDDFGDENEEKVGLEENQEFERYLVPLIPMFEDEAMVPEGEEAERFVDTTGPTSPTFY